MRCSHRRLSPGDVGASPAPSPAWPRSMHMPLLCRSECQTAGAGCFAVGTARASVCRGWGVAMVTSCLQAVPPSYAAVECAGCCMQAAAAASHDTGLPLHSMSGDKSALMSCSPSGPPLVSLGLCAPLLFFRGSPNTDATCVASACWPLQLCRAVLLAHQAVAEKRSATSSDRRASCAFDCGDVSSNNSDSSRVADVIETFQLLSQVAYASYCTPAGYYWECRTPRQPQLQLSQLHSG